MKIALTKRELDEALTFVNISLGAASSDDYTSRIYIKVVEEEAEEPADHDGMALITVLATNGRMISEIPIQAKVSYKAEETKHMVFEGWRLRQWVSAVPNAPVEFESEDEDSYIIAKGPHGEVKFRSHQMIDLETWKESYSKIELKAVIDPKRLHEALSYVKSFVGEQDAKYPGIAVVEVQNKRLMATDLIAVAALEVKPLEDLSLRVHGKDISAVLSFLSACGTNPVKIREDDALTYFEREDGAMFIVSRPKFELPDINIGDRLQSEDPVWIKISPKEIRSAVMALTAGADRENHHVYFVPEKESKSVRLRMKSSAGDGSQWNEIRLVCEDVGGEGFGVYPATGAPLDYKYVISALGSSKREDAIVLGFHVIVQDARKTGFVRVCDHRSEGDVYWNLIKWARFVEG